jgi:hypothetical protein
VDLAHGVALLQPRADDLLRAAVAGEQRRLEAPRREQARARADGGAADDVVEDAPRQHGERAGDVEAAAARPDAGHVAGALRRGHGLLVDTEALERMVRVGDQAVAADLVAWEIVLVDEDDVDARARKPLGAGRAGGTGADDEDVASGRKIGNRHGNTIVGNDPGRAGPGRAGDGRGSGLQT